MIHHYKTPVISQTRDVRPKYQDPTDPNYDYKNWGKPVGFKSSKSVRLTIDIDFGYQEEHSGPVKIILEQLHALLCQSAEGMSEDPMNYDMKYTLGFLEGYFTEHKDHKKIAHIPEGAVGPVDRFPRKGKIPVSIEPPPDKRTAHEVSKAALSMKLAELVDTIKEQPISEEMKIALGEFSWAWVDIIIKAMESSSIAPPEEE